MNEKYDIRVLVKFKDGTKDEQLHHYDTLDIPNIISYYSKKDIERFSIAVAKPEHWDKEL